MNKMIYNVTVSVDEPVHEDWLHWMKTVHVPDVMATGFFTSSKICRVLAHEEGGVTYAMQHLELYWRYCMKKNERKGLFCGIHFFFELPCFLIKSVRTMFASALTTVPSFQVVLLCENNIPLLRVIKISFLNGYFFVKGHNTKLAN
jgi:hypothetical protein